MIRKAVKAKILVVDDEPEVASSLAQSLDENGYEVITAKDDREALYYFDKVQPDLIILDIRFGPYDERMGLDILKEIRELRDDKATPIIILTGLSEEELVLLAKLARSLEEATGRSQDVEFGFDPEGNLLLFQVRRVVPHA